MNGTFDDTILIAEVFHCPVFPPVLQGEQELVPDWPFRDRLAATLVSFVEGLLENFQHSVKRCLLHAEKPFELFVGESQGFLNAFGYDGHGGVVKKGEKQT
jgi:hypothetical protein